MLCRSTGYSTRPYTITSATSPPNNSPVSLTLEYPPLIRLNAAYAVVYEMVTLVCRTPSTYRVACPVAALWVAANTWAAPSLTTLVPFAWYHDPAFSWLYWARPPVTPNPSSTPLLLSPIRLFAALPGYPDDVFMRVVRTTAIKLNPLPS